MLVTSSPALLGAADRVAVLHHGALLACDHEGVKPDGLTLGKALGGGLPIGALVISPEDELFAITSNGGVIRTPVKPVRRTRDRNTMGVKLMDLPEGVTIVALARNADEPDEQD